MSPSNVTQVAQPFFDHAAFGFVHLSGIVANQFAKRESDKFLHVAEVFPKFLFCLGAEVGRQLYAAHSWIHTVQIGCV